jgi:hypothetical protein
VIVVRVTEARPEGEGDADRGARAGKDPRITHPK